MGKISLSISTLLFLVLSLALMSSDVPDHFHQHYRVYGVPMPQKLHFAGEDVPLHDMEVKERIDRELLVNVYWQSNTVLQIKRATRWLPVLDSVLKKHEIPADFKYLAVIESGLINTISPAEATGFWQLLKGTGQEYGLEISEEVDERYDPAKATEAACRFFKKAYARFGSWTLVAAAYNMGQAGLARQIELQGENNFYRLWLNNETSRYIARILAVKMILESPVQYGFHIHENDCYPTYSFAYAEIDSSVSDWAVVARQLGVSYKNLRYYNPWIRKNQLNNPQKRLYKVAIAP